MEKEIEGVEEAEAEGGRLLSPEAEEVGSGWGWGEGYIQQGQANYESNHWK